MFKEIYSGLVNYPELSVFLSTFLLGDELVYFLSFLSGSGVINYWTVVFFSILGNGGCDIFWISVARSDYFKILKRFILNREKVEMENIKEISRGKMFSMLLLSKFFYGTRLLTIFGVSRKNKKFRRVIFYNTLSVIVWVLVVSSVMWSFGRFFYISFNNFWEIHRIIGFGVLFVVLIYILNRILSSRTLNQKKFRR